MIRTNFKRHTLVKGVDEQKIQSTAKMQLIFWLQRANSENEHRIFSLPTFNLGQYSWKKLWIETQNASYFCVDHYIKPVFYISGYHSHISQTILLWMFAKKKKKREPCEWQDTFWIKISIHRHRIASIFGCFKTKDLSAKHQRAKMIRQMFLVNCFRCCCYKQKTEGICSF